MPSAETMVLVERPRMHAGHGISEGAGFDA
jgi:hypothetical protein